jgi:hypothetical protein
VEAPGTSPQPEPFRHFVGADAAWATLPQTESGRRDASELKDPQYGDSLGASTFCSRMGR